jgi:hypothetical protein
MITLPVDWWMISEGDLTLIHHTYDPGPPSLKIGYLRKDYYVRVEYYTLYSDEAHVYSFVLSKTKEGDSLCRIVVNHEKHEYHIRCHYRLNQHEYRFICLLAEPPVPIDILRHIYSFIKQ